MKNVCKLQTSDEWLWAWRAILEIGGRKLVAITLMQIFIPVWIKIIMSNAPREVRNVSLKTASTLTRLLFCIQSFSLLFANENKTKTNAGTIYIKSQNKNKNRNHMIVSISSSGAREKVLSEPEAKQNANGTQSPRGTHSPIIFTAATNSLFGHHHRRVNLSLKNIKA